MRRPAPSHTTRVRTLARWDRYVDGEGTLTGLRRFHARHRLLILAHDPDACRAVGRLVESAPLSDLETVRSEYGRRLEEALARPASRAQHLLVLEHVARSLVDRLSAAEQRALTEALHDYRRNDVHLSVPKDLLRTLFLRLSPGSGAARRTYLELAA